VSDDANLFKDLSKLNATVTYINANYDSSVKFTELAENITSMSRVYDFNKTINRFLIVNRMNDIFGCGDDGAVIDSSPISRFSDYLLIKDGVDYFFNVEVRGLTLDKRIYVYDYNGEQLSSVSYNRFSRNLSVKTTTVFNDFKLKEIESRDYKKSDVTINNGVLTVKLSPRH
jgi:hypothetical protein